MYRSTIICFSMLLVSNAVSAITIDETVSQSLSYHPALSAATKEQTVTEFQIDEAKKWLPAAGIYRAIYRPSMG